jgi:lipoate-protein ligase A
LSLQGVRSVRLILHPPRDGQWNMAVDEALLTGVAEGTPVVRLYGFSPPTLSVGRFQRVRARLDPEALKRSGVTLVRRPTGGQAVLHDDELTYAVILGRRHVEPFGKREVYRFISGLLLRGLERLGVRGRSSHARLGSAHNPDCFRSTGEYEIASPAQRKLIGSAQILNRTGSLQHGAIPLGPSYRRITTLMETGAPGGGRESGPGAAPGKRDHADPGCLSEELGRVVSFQEAQEGFAAGFSEAFVQLGAGVVPDDLSAEESRLADDLLEKRYGRDEWNLKY